MTSDAKSDIDTLAAVTIDVDGAGCYHAIHGLPPLPGDDVLWSRALPRFFALCDALHIRATVFVVGIDLDVPERAARIAEAARSGHEIASHSHRHDYALSRAGRIAIDDDTRAAVNAIERVTGARPRGFRAPGYNQSELLFDALERHGFLYDSSFLPVPAYFAARAAALALYTLRRRRSRSLVGDAREFASPLVPFIPSRAARYRPARGRELARPLVELPIGVASSLRLPWLGTSLTMFPDALGRLLTTQALGMPGPAVLELHAIDFASKEDGLSTALVAAQADLRVPLDVKLRRLRSTFEAMGAHRTVVPLEEIAQRVRRHCGRAP